MDVLNFRLVFFFLLMNLFLKPKGSFGYTLIVRFVAERKVDVASSPSSDSQYI